MFCRGSTVGTVINPRMGIFEGPFPLLSCQVGKLDTFLLIVFAFPEAAFSFDESRLGLTPVGWLAGWLGLVSFWRVLGFRIVSGCGHAS